MTQLTQAQLKEINNAVRYTMVSVFSCPGRLGQTTDRDAMIADLTDRLAGFDDKDLTIRGFYDISGMRADADWMVWWHAPEITTLQQAYKEVLRSELGSASEPFWSCAAAHRPAEFNRGHVPAFMAGEEPRDFVCVYPFVRSYDWYLLPESERREILAEHGRAARDYADVRANTVQAFALGDYEWLLAFEADDVMRIVDLMRDLRATRARHHVREEIPFFTGPRVSLAELIQDLP